MIIEKFNSPEEMTQSISRSKSDYNAQRKDLPFSEKLKILQKLQEKAYFFGKTKVKPWPILQQSERVSNHGN